MFATVLLVAALGVGQKAPDPPAASIFVDDDNAGQQDGSARRPFRTVGQAVAAAKDGGVIAVAGGTYPENVRVQGKAVKLYGGYAGGTKAGYAGGTAGDFKTRDPAANVSHLKGDGKDSVVTLSEAGASVVDGFRVTGGGRSALTKPQWLGGGFYVADGSPTIANNVIEKNQTCKPTDRNEDARGGGIYSAGGDITIANNVIRDNVSGRGAGIAVNGGKAVIRGNTVQGNIGVGDHGGGLHVFSPKAEISHNRIAGNEIGRALGYGWGGGMIVFNKGGVYAISHNVFTGNFAPSVGSALFVDDGAVATSDHDLFYANAANLAGDGIVTPVYVDGSEDGLSSTLTISHATVADHTCKPAAAGFAMSVTNNSKLIVSNSILWNSGGGDVDADKTSKATVTYTLTEKARKGVGNLSKDPLFADPATGDYRLRSTGGRWNPAAKQKQGDWVIDDKHSPAIDAADPAAPFKLEPAPHGDRANLGADGNTARASKSAR